MINEKNIQILLAEEKDILKIIEILKERCDWFKKNRIDQWNEKYYKEIYNVPYFKQARRKHHLYVVKDQEEIIGLFLLKEEDKVYWHDEENAYYIHHFVHKIGYPGLGKKMLSFIEEKAKIDHKTYLRGDCMRSNPKINDYWESLGFKKRKEGDIPYSYRLWEKRV